MASTPGRGGAGTVSSDDAVWIYHERQEAALCGQHALNNLSQSPVFTVAQLSEIAFQLDSLERRVLDPSPVFAPSNNVDEAGNFSIQVLKQALDQVYGIPLPILSVSLQESGTDITDYQGFICHKSDHWFSIRKVGGRFWNMNSMLERPIPVSHFQLATEMEKWQGEGYTLFAILTGLPEGGTKIEGLGVGNWHLMSDLLRGKSTGKDPWAGMSGQGMRLDGGGGAGAASIANGVGGPGQWQEEDDLQRALQMSLQEHEVTRQQEQLADVVVPDEPPAGAPGAARLQLRLPSGKRLVRRFAASDSVRVVYAVVRQQDDAPAGKRLELKYGFPPKDLADLQTHTIGEAKLAGESIQGRYV